MGHLLVTDAIRESLLALLFTCHNSSAGERMHAMLAERVNEVGDYCFRVYKGTSKAGFVHSPVTEYDTLCSQVGTCALKTNASALHFAYQVL